jgi:hypothetical protein
MKGVDKSIETNNYSLMIEGVTLIIQNGINGDKLF